MMIEGVLVEGIDEVMGLIKDKVMIEAPIGLNKVAVALSRIITEKYGVKEVIVSGRNAWGACDIIAPPPGFDLIHIGHALPPNIASLMRMNGYVAEKNGVKTVITGKGFKAYILPAYYVPDDDVVEALARNLGKYEGSFVLYPILYKLYAESLAKRIHGTALGPFTGCFMPVKADKVVVVSGGYFYALTAKLINPSSRVMVADPHRVIVEDIEPVYRKYISLKVNSLLKAMEARRIAIVLTSKPGQGNINHALSVKRRLRQNGKDAFILYVDEVSSETINNIDADAIVIEACPRISLDDLDRVNKPLIAPLEVRYIINGKISEYKAAAVTLIPLNDGQ
ncbi:diphthamide synthesis protein [Caldivirga sp.]|uniref:diphthamide synthesis protein n=1 Tax=Caldivirga sp. TaxID=2080243 RepID=UPI0025C63C7B|nr:diphthamide synthesis protein [Caldivirga sp.]